MAREKHVYVYWDDHLKGHGFVYYKPNSNSVICSDGVYDRVSDAENSAWLCCFGDPDELDDAGFVKEKHCKTLSIH
jgi:hypothetical protein